jgi:16S rRNA (guanine527-N7)-methyltransferase
VSQVLLADELIQKTLAPYGIPIDLALCEQIRLYVSTLLQWNAKIALTSVTDPKDVLKLHFGDSFYAAEKAGITKGRVADIGTGAGFPGIPIRMVRPAIELTLVEPIGKKTAFLGEVVRRLNLSGVDIIRCRMEEVPDSLGKLDFVTARALGQYEKLLRWSKSRLSANGKVVLLIGTEEIESLSKLPEWNWEEPHKVPNSEAKFVFIGHSI